MVWKRLNVQMNGSGGDEGGEGSGGGGEGGENGDGVEGGGEPMHEEWEEEGGGK